MRLMEQVNQSTAHDLFQDSSTYEGINGVVHVGAIFDDPIDGPDVVEVIVKRKRRNGDVTTWTYTKTFVELTAAEKAVAKGAEFLDLFLVGQDWRSAIALDTLDITSGWKCILGQTAVMAHLDNGADGYGQFAEHVIALGIAPADEGIVGPWFRDRGFYSNGQEHTYAELQEAWEQELLKAVDDNVL